MIDTLLTVAYWLVWGLTLPLRLLPNASLPVALTNAITSANNYLAVFDFVFPIGTFIAIVALTITIEGFILLYKVIKWLWNKIPGIN